MWINIFIALIFSVAILNMHPYFNKIHENLIYSGWMNTQFLLPLLVIISGGMISKIFTIDFDWLYPIPIILATGAIFLYRKLFYSILELPSIYACLTGVLVFLEWVILVPVDPIQNIHFYEEIQSVSIEVALFWLLFRIIGATLIVPISEEFAFRAFMLPRLDRWIHLVLERSILFNYFFRYINLISIISSLIITSLLFGILHADIIAGSIAGFLFGLAYLRRRKVIDAIASHFLANLLLSIDVVFYGNWSYW